jgi:hypothetical protein
VPKYCNVTQLLTDHYYPLREVWMCASLMV